MTWSSHILLANGEVPVTSTADDVTTTTTVEFDFPPETIAEGTLIAGFAVAAVLLIAVLWRDTSRVGAVARGWLFLLRMAAFLGVLVIALNPHQRTQQESFKPSQVVLLADTSTSMQQPAGDPSSIASSEPAELRWEAVRRLLAESQLLDTLREQHVERLGE